MNKQLPPWDWLWWGDFCSINISPISCSEKKPARILENIFPDQVKLLYKANRFSLVKKETVLNCRFVSDSLSSPKHSIVYLPGQMVTDNHRWDSRNFPWLKVTASLLLQRLSGAPHFQKLVCAEVQRPNFLASIWDISEVPSAKASVAIALQFKFSLCLIQLPSLINGMDEWQNGNYESVHFDHRIVFTEDLHIL